MKMRIPCYILAVILLLTSTIQLPVFAEDIHTSTTISELQTTDSSASVIEHDTIFVAVGAYYTFTPQIEVASCYVLPLNYTGAISVINNSTIFQGIREGTETLLVYYTTLEGESRCESCLVRVIDFTADNYMIKPKNSTASFVKYNNNNIVNHESPVEITSISSQNRSKHSFILTHTSNGFFKIQSSDYQAYLGVSEIAEGATVNFIVPLLNLEILDSYILEWQLKINHENVVTLVPLGGASSNLVLSMSATGEGLILASVDSSYNNEWEFFTENIHINNYYDSSVMDDPTFIENITEATYFLNEYAFSSITANIEFTEPIYYDNDSGDCGTGFCTNNCNTACIKHHKNINRISDVLRQIPRGKNQVSVMWADRPPTAYCIDDATGVHSPFASYDTNGNIEYTAAQTSYSRNYGAYIQFFTIDHNLPFEDMKLGIMSMILAHEMAHVLGLPEVTDSPTHTSTSCIMEYMSLNSMYVLYLYLTNTHSIDSIFCSSCITELKNLANIWQTGDNYNLE